MGFDDREIVALSGAHTIGRAFAERSGTVSEGYGPKKGSVYTKPTHIARGDGKKGIGMAGGRSWTKQWLTFDNSCAPRIPAPHALDDLVPIRRAAPAYALRFRKKRNRKRVLHSRRALLGVLQN